jgi:signal transduction histidine kinase
VPLPRVLRTTTFRLAAIYVGGFAAAVAILGVAIYLATAGLLERRLDNRIEREMQQLTRSFKAGGASELIDAVRQREENHRQGTFGYVVITDGARVAGDLRAWPKTPGWSTLPYVEPDGDRTTRRFLVVDLGTGLRLAVAADREEVEKIKETIFDGFVSAFAAVLLLGIAGGFGLSFVLLRRVETIRRTAQAIIAGDLTQRVPVRGTGDDFDRLSQTLNHMLDRIGELMASLREVSANIAHDLKTPLARLRHRLEAARTQPGAPDRLVIEEAVAEVDEILATFSALLRIAQIEAGTRRAGFRPVDLSEIFNTIADAFAPAAEDAGRILTAAISPGLCIVGDRELLTQMLANIVDNAIRHTSSGARIVVGLARDARGIVGSVTDDGPGVPAGERERIFERFRRLPQSRAVPGSGLGLSLAKAVADIHGIALTAEDAGPGLRLTMRFPTGGAAGSIRPA